MSSRKPLIETFDMGDIIFREGDSGQQAYLIQSGSVNIIKNLKGKQQVLATLKEGEIFGEMAIISKSPRVAGAQAVTECRLVVLTARLLMLLLKKSHPTVFHLTRILAKRLASVNQSIAENRSENSWMTFCRLLFMKHKISSSTPNEGGGVDYNEFCTQLIDITNMPQVEITRFLKSAVGFNLVSTARMGRKVLVSINNPDVFLEVAGGLSEDINRFGGKVSLADYMDIDDFAAMVDSNPEMIYKKIGTGDFPEDICVLHREATTSWANRQGKQFFKESKRVRKSVDELDGVDDIVFVDIGTLKQVFKRLGYYKLGVLLAIADPEAKKRILMSISKKIAAAIMRDSRSPEAINRNEADDVEEELIEAIRYIKCSASASL